ncbi:tRNA 2'-phosphotransferase [Aspergillus novofumigatus IBT 16806]|uniref:2'-phosphotransferase n=1 Tax=Aspergillus novofumigatus (strain IBT 16806) TaxID=1392255 RepID=A0A2I1CKQ7_ASPN1|nr:phosphotransferase 1 [Aspergillus novofumigatus IBT 16806]PKX98204.1 phosphotransferase 1 [Aspergillus novofumigatus IBT 16806]
MSQNQRRGRGGNQSREVTISKALSLLLRHAAEKEGLKMDSQGYANVADVLAWKKIKSLKVTLPEIIHAVASSDKKRFALLHIPSAKALSDTTTTGEREGETPVCETEPSSMPTSQVPTTSAGQENATATALAVNDTDPSHFLIRATQGHSIKSVDAAAFLERLTLEDEARLPDTVVHGTYHAVWSAILQSGGLRCMGRNQVHFATGPSLESVLPTHVDGTAHSATTPSGLNDGRVISGMRRDAQILIYIDIKKAMAAGCPFWRSENGVILSEGVDVGGVRRLEMAHRKRSFPLNSLMLLWNGNVGSGRFGNVGKRSRNCRRNCFREAIPRVHKQDRMGGEGVKEMDDLHDPVMNKSY